MGKFNQTEAKDWSGMKATGGLTNKQRKALADAMEKYIDNKLREEQAR